MSTFPAARPWQDPEPSPGRHCSECGIRTQRERRRKWLLGNSPGVLTATGTTTVNTGSIFAWTIDTDVGGGVRGTEFAGLNTTSVGGTGAVFQIVTTDSQGFRRRFLDDEITTVTDIFKSADGSTSLTLQRLVHNVYVLCLLRWHQPDHECW